MSSRDIDKIPLVTIVIIRVLIIHDGNLKPDYVFTLCMSHLVVTYVMIIRSW